MAKDDANKKAQLLKELAQKNVPYARESKSDSWTKTADAGVVVDDPDVTGGYVIYTWSDPPEEWDKGDDHCAAGYEPVPPAPGGGKMPDGFQIAKACRKK